MAELALAILPLSFEAVKLGKEAARKVVIASGYMDTVAEIRLQLEVQCTKVSHECESVLREALESQSASSVRLHQLLGNTEHYGWKSPDLENSIQSYLGSSQEPFRLLLALVNQKIRNLNEKLSRFDEADERGKEVSACQICFQLAYIRRVEVQRAEWGIGSLSLSTRKLMRRKL